MPLPMPKASPQQLGMMLQGLPTSQVPQQPLGAQMPQFQPGPPPNRPAAQGMPTNALMNPQMMQQLMARQQAAGGNAGMPMSLAPPQMPGAANPAGALPPMY